MAHLIDKDALVAEIVKMLQEEYPCDNSEQTTGYHCALYELQDFINSLEVKEVDLKEEVERFAKECGYSSAATIDFQFAKHFFELGMAVSNKAQKGENI